jgi:succinate-acetate transporter protein
MPVTVKITLGLMSLLAVIWFAFGILAAGNLITTIPSIQIRLVIGGVAIISSLGIAVFTYLLFRQNRMAYKLTLVLLSLIFLLSFADDLGWVDFSLIVILATVIGLLVKDRAWYLRQKSVNKNASG